MDYDYLIIAMGARPNTFNTPGVVENCNFLKVTSSEFQCMLSLSISLSGKFWRDRKSGIELLDAHARLNCTRKWISSAGS